MSSRGTLLSLVAVPLIACGGAIAGTESPPASGDAGSPAADASGGGGVGPDGGLLEDSGGMTLSLPDTGSDTGLAPVFDANPCPSTLAGWCAEPGTECPASAAQAGLLCLTGGASVAEGMCGGYEVVSISLGNGDAGTLYLYYGPNGLEGVVQWSGFVHGGSGPVCTIGAGPFPDGTQCALSACPTQINDPGACPMASPTPGSACTTNALVCQLDGCAPCECVFGEWACEPSPPCGPMR